MSADPDPVGHAMPAKAHLDATGESSPRPVRPRALPTVATLAAIIVFVAAGNWQHGRMQSKEALREQLDAAARADPVALDHLAPDGDWTALRFRPVVATGKFVAARQILIDNKVYAGRAGYQVVTPLALADGRVVLVNRGWVAQGTSRADLPSATPPAGVVLVRGRLAIPTTNYLELRADAPKGPVWQNLDPARFRAATGIEVLPVVVEETDAPTPGGGLVRDWPAPDFGIEQHRIYMVQWYAFALTAVVLWAWFYLRRSGGSVDA